MATLARRLAMRVLAEVERGGGLLADRLAAPDIEALPTRDRSFLHELVLGTLRRRGALDHALRPLLTQPFSRLPPAARNALRLGAYQLLFLRVPDRASVSESVDLTREAAPRLAGMVNAVLRRLAGEGPPPLPDPVREPGAWLTSGGSLPKWLADRWLKNLGAPGAVARARALLEAPLAAFRLNPRMADAEEQARSAGLPPQPLVVPGALAAGGGSGSLAALARRHVVYVQDQGSQLIAHLAAGSGWRLDACAAPGSKSTLMADLSAGATVVAAELSLRRLATLARTVAAWGCANVRLVAADAMRPPLRASFDGVLLDAPCSGLGTLARHPDIRWRAREADIMRHAERQLRMIRSVSALLKPGGRLVYAVCSAEPEEGPEIVAAFRADRAAFRPAPLPEWAYHFAVSGEDGVCRTRPERDGGDAFFAAVLERG